MSKTRPPAWWGKFTSSLPKFDLPGIEPETWTVELAQKWIRAIPAKCPFEREVWWRGILVLYIPALCPLNPISTQLYKIRIEAQQYLLSANPDTTGTDLS
jgi:hypothetical protein